ncbi:hypothetical protein B0T24DRAFT_381570 [Lasiosphaeria ovina]|uniref:Uncharacterized protein n=1 Tax=Lasiosphaeria ovina TaxID=92902 RepID=A0AAE0K042_9PEZI|nr:hypothetical protein B0T24DRAFT_381570 [Lasiosphaeria ovina]
MEWLFYLPWNRKSTKGVREELGSYITLHSVFDFLRTGHVSIAQDSRTLMAEQSQNGLHLVSHGFARLGHTLEMAALRTPRGTSFFWITAGDDLPSAPGLLFSCLLPAISCAFFWVCFHFLLVRHLLDTIRNSGQGRNTFLICFGRRMEAFVSF